MFLLNAIPPVLGAVSANASASVNSTGFGANGTSSLSGSLDGLGETREEMLGSAGSVPPGGVRSDTGNALGGMGADVKSMVGGMFGGVNKGAAQTLRALIGLLRAIAGLQQPSPQPMTPTATDHPPAEEGTGGNRQNLLEMIISFLERLVSVLEPENRNGPMNDNRNPQQPGAGLIPGFGLPGVGPAGGEIPSALDQSPVFGSGAANTDLGSGGSSLPGLEVPVGGGRNIPPQGPM